MEQLINWYPCRSITGALLCGDITFGLWTLEVLYVPLCVWYHIYLIKIKGCDVYIIFVQYTIYLIQNIYTRKHPDDLFWHPWRYSMEDLLGVSCYLPSGLIALVANAHPKSCHSNERGFVTGHPTTVLVSTDISVYMSAFQRIRSVLTF